MFDAIQPPDDGILFVYIAMMFDYFIANCGYRVDIVMEIDVPCAENGKNITLK